VVELREAMSSKGSFFHSSSGLTPHVSQIHLDYNRMEGQLRATQDELTTEKEANRAMRDLWASYNTQMQAFVAVRKKDIFVAFLIVSDMYVC
jgi:hypothetical protein